MKVFSTKQELREFLAGDVAGVGRPLCLVPTMGALHRGHGALIEQAVAWARQRGGLAAVSLFVNPAQFEQEADFTGYPQSLEADLALCEAAGADVVFVPRAEEIYAADASVSVGENALSLLWEGASRAGHFAGVCLVLTKLFSLFGRGAGEFAAVFGEKDWQQVAVVRRLVRDLDLGVEIFVHEVVREASGLALSSRNARLSEAVRARAAGIYASLAAMRERLAGSVLLDGQSLSVAELEALGRGLLGQVAGLEVDYLALVDEESLLPLAALEPVQRVGARVLFAGWLEGVRLLDTMGMGY